MSPADLLRAIDRSHRMPAAACPRCQQALNHATGVIDDDAPSPGDVSICAFCEVLLEYQPDFSFRLMTDAEVAALPEEFLVLLLDAVERARMMRKALRASK